MKARWFRRARNRATRKAIILMYHRIGEPGLDPWRLAVSPRHFSEHLEVMRAECVPVALSELLRGGLMRTIPDRAVVVTFDDGYADNLHRAKPLLETHAVAATAFLTTDQLGRDGEFWWDELERRLLLPPHLPERLRLRIRAETHEWEVPRGLAGSRREWFREVWRALLPLTSDERKVVLDRLADWSTDATAPRPEYRALRPEEAVDLARGGLIEIGAHTLTHPLLSSQEGAVREHEIRGSKRALEELLGRGIDAFSYPHGDFDDATTRLVEEAGFRIACTVRPDVVWRGSNALRLPRCAVEDWEAEEFGRRLEAWFSG